MPPLNHAVKITKVKPGDKFSEKVEGGHYRRSLSESGYIVTDFEGNEIFIPKSLLKELSK